MSRFSTTLLALALLAPLAACDSADSEDLDTRALEDISNMVEVDSDQGAFRVLLWNDMGDLVVGPNTLMMRIGFHDPIDPESPGKGIPNADVDLDAWMPTANESMPTEPVVTYLGDGEYLIENVVLTEDGVWNFDFELTVGENMHESVSLAFDV